MIQKIQIHISLLSLLLVVYSCRQHSTPKQEAETGPHNEKQTTETHFIKFDPDTIPALTINGFTSDYSFKIGQNYLVVGYYMPVDGQIVPPDTEDNWGDRLLFLDAKKSIVYTSKGVGDVYLYEPHFFKSTSGDKIIVVCQLGYEYFFGGDAYLIENTTIRYIGAIDIENYRDEKRLVDILNIKSIDSTIVFSFDTDSLVLQPGSEDIPVANNNIRYEYDYNALKLIK
ncbi:hypothetical protein H9Y05_11305 [Crocinitomicaceae bacterium CZZ-1]|uniref:Uncharacterized protein n=1 Tax=Taishania pollutisoli TaxID=2766479 RepID=A0A8J6PJT1_9FLAO|nr:hypothetical protein [Taishania pollutisoli]MBC9813056.1 hypothetical protein [Taishania pollutisoli]